MSDTPRKWEWIAARCKEIGFHEAAEIAEKMDKILVELYDMKLTPEWITQFKHIPKIWETTKETTYIHTVAIRRNYCVPCVVNKLKCETCVIVEKYGWCYKPESLFWRFLDAFDSGVRTDE